MYWLLNLIVSLLKALVPWAIRESRPTAEEADRDIETRDRLRAEIREHWSDE